MELLISVSVGFAILILVLMGAAFAPPAPRKVPARHEAPVLTPGKTAASGALPSRGQIDQSRRAAERLSADLLGNAIRH